MYFGASGNTFRHQWWSFRLLANSRSWLGPDPVHSLDNLLIPRLICTERPCTKDCPWFVSVRDCWEWSSWRRTGLGRCEACGLWRLGMKRVGKLRHEMDEVFRDEPLSVPPANRHAVLPVLYGSGCSVLSGVVWAPGLRGTAPPAACDAVCGDYRGFCGVRAWTGAEGVEGGAARCESWRGRRGLCWLGVEGWDGNVRGPDVREYLYPVECDGRLLGAYVQMAQDFRRLVAVHHVACAIWEDLKAQAPTRDASAIRAGDVEVDAKLLRMVLGRGDGSSMSTGAFAGPGRAMRVAGTGSAGLMGDGESF
ncbi:hypothetical protein BU15DRAFT_68040 [Melanogaster broomeanus]|nr:hypothetical protein BU15DRAFT_68040 [Melanogaster broomeanus]